MFWNSSTNVDKTIPPSRLFDCLDDDTFSESNCIDYINWEIISKINSPLFAGSVDSFSVPTYTLIFKVEHEQILA